MKVNATLPLQSGGCHVAPLVSRSLKHGKIGQVAKSLFTLYCASGVTCALCSGVCYAHLGGKLAKEERFYSFAVSATLGFAYGLADGVKIGFGWPFGFASSAQEKKRGA